jgi:transposase-like protein
MHCAGLNCLEEAHYFRCGSLHWVDTSERVAEKPTATKHMIWLCAECSRRYVVETWRPAGQQVRSRSHVSPEDYVSMSVPIRSTISIPASKSAEAFGR